jgi:hypothetical protein
MLAAAMGRISRSRLTTVPEIGSCPRRAFRKLTLGATDSNGELALREAELLAPELDFDRHRSGHEPTTEVTKPRHRPVQLWP